MRVFFSLSSQQMKLKNTIAFLHLHYSFSTFFTVELMALLCCCCCCCCCWCTSFHFEQISRRKVLLLEAKRWVLSIKDKPIHMYEVDASILCKILWQAAGGNKCTDTKKYFERRQRNNFFPSSFLDCGDMLLTYIYGRNLDQTKDSRYTCIFY